MDSRQWSGEDQRDALTPAKDTPARMASTCQGCGVVVYAVGVRLANGGVLCRRCAEQAEREPEPDGEDFRGQEAAGYLAEQQHATQRVKR